MTALTVAPKALWRTGEHVRLPAELERRLQSASYAPLRGLLVLDFAESGRIYLRDFNGDPRHANVAECELSLEDVFGASWRNDSLDLTPAVFFDGVKGILDAARRHGAASILLDAPWLASCERALEFRDYGARITGYTVYTTSRLSGRVHASNDCTVLDLETVRRVSYRVVNVDQPVFDLMNPNLANLIGDRRTLAVVDKRIMARYGIALSSYLEKRSNLATCITLAGGERGKRWRSIERICSAALGCHLERSAVMVAIGGGTVMDLVGVAASLYRRGIDYVRIPTTLIGIVDVAVGIKTAFNFREKKNALGAFHAPVGAIADRCFLQTLPGRHLAGGIAEILKMGIICDERLFSLIETYGRRLMQTKFGEPRGVAKEVVLRAQAAMMDELEPNLFEDDKRRLVDFGHTISPLLEAESSYQIHHGEAVALDMLFSSALSVTLGLCDYPLYVRMRSLYERVGLPVSSRKIDAGLVRRAFEDTKSHRGQLNLVVPTRVGGTAFLQSVRDEDIKTALQLLP